MVHTASAGMLRCGDSVQGSAKKDVYVKCSTLQYIFFYHEETLILSSVVVSYCMTDPSPWALPGPRINPGQSLQQFVL